MKKKIFILFYSFVLLTHFAFTENKTALVIGNSAYQYFPKLSQPWKEATDMKETLQRLGFEVIFVLDGTYERIFDSISLFEEKLKQKGGIAFFHYGGHGVQVDGENYLLPVDKNIPDERRVRSRAINATEIVDVMATTGTTTNIIVLDACRDNPLPVSNRSTNNRGLTKIKTPVNTIVVYSAESDSTAQDGIFTPTLIKYLEEEDLSFRDILTKVRYEVYNQTGGKQIPGAYDQLFHSIYLSHQGGYSENNSVNDIRLKASIENHSLLNNTKHLPLPRSHIGEFFLLNDERILIKRGAGGYDIFKINDDQLIWNRTFTDDTMDTQFPWVSAVSLDSKYILMKSNGSTKNFAILDDNGNIVATHKIDFSSWYCFSFFSSDNKSIVHGSGTKIYFMNFSGDLEKVMDLGFSIKDLEEINGSNSFLVSTDGGLKIIDSNGKIQRTIQLQNVEYKSVDVSSDGKSFIMDGCVWSFDGRKILDKQNKNGYFKGFSKDGKYLIYISLQNDSEQKTIQLYSHVGDLIDEFVIDEDYHKHHNYAFTSDYRFLITSHYRK